MTKREQKVFREFLEELTEDIQQEFNRLRFVHKCLPTELLLRQAYANIYNQYSPKTPGNIQRLQKAA